MSDRARPSQRTGDESGGTTAEDARAEERATDEGMPARPGNATAGATAGPDGPATVADAEEQDGEHDVGGEA
jgi:hypothetical protein